MAKGKGGAAKAGKSKKSSAKGVKTRVIKLLSSRSSTLVCRPSLGGFDVEIRMRGKAMRLEGFEFPQDGTGAQYPDMPDPVPFDPVASTDLGLSQDLGVDPTDGKWECTFTDQCEDDPKTRTIVLWFTYVNQNTGDEHRVIETFVVLIPACSGIPECA